MIGEAEELKDLRLFPQAADVIVTELEESDITPELYKLAKAFKVIMLASKRTPDAFDDIEVERLKRSLCST